MNRPAISRRQVHAVPMARIDLEIPLNVLAALDSYARAQGVSRSTAARLALCCDSRVADVLSRHGVPSADVVGP